MAIKGDDKQYPKILVISNNPFSCTSNNGKTLASFFDNYPSEKIAQLYFSTESPDDIYYENYYRISDVDVIKSFFNIGYKCGGRVKISNNGSDIRSLKDNKSILEAIKKYNIFRIGRELLWRYSKWESYEFSNWINQFSPDIIFLCAGDSGFAYNIASIIKKKFQSKLVVYITDDYVMKRSTVSIFWWLRRNYIKKKMKVIIRESNLFITISKKMQSEYRMLFDKDSILAVNMSESLKSDILPVSNKAEVTLVYTGGFHYNRYKVLGAIANSIKEINEDSDIKMNMKIYSTQVPTKKILNYINVEGSSVFCGSLNKEQLKQVLNECDIPIFVESFDKKSIEATRLSLSTKIPEYLSLGKPILSVGPKDVSSIEYLQDCSFCITDIDNITDQLYELLRNTDIQNELANNALNKYCRNHQKRIVSEKMISNIINIQ